MPHKKTPTLLQMEVTECGAACLGIILGFYGRYIPLSQLRIDCGVSRDGCSAYNIVVTAERYGLIAQGFEVEDVNELNQLSTPFMVHWKFNHMIVVEGINKGKVYINDPGQGRRAVSMEEFSRAFTGVAMTFSIDENVFKKEGRPLSLLFAIKQRIVGAHSALMFVLVTSFALLFTGLILPGISKIFIDDVLIHDQKKWLAPLLAALLCVALLRAILTWLQRRFLLNLQLKLMLRTGAQLFWHLLSLPFAFFQQRLTGDLTDRISANDRMTQLLAGKLGVDAINILFVAVYGVVIAILSWKLFLIGMCVLLLNTYIFTLISQQIADKSWQFLQKRGALTNLEMNGIRAIESIKSTAQGYHYFSRWAGAHADTLYSRQRVLLNARLFELVPMLLSGLAMAAVLGVGCWLIMQGQLTVGALVAVQMLFMGMNGPVMSLLQMGRQLNEMRGDFMRIDDVFYYEPERGASTQSANVTINQPKKNMQQESGVALTLSHVNFSYATHAALVIDDMSLSIKAGERIAITGRTGCGKSTLAKLVCRLYAPLSGNIELNNCQLAEYSTEDIANTLVYVDQDSTLISGTIRDHLTLWDTTINDDDLMQACEAAQIADVVIERGGLSAYISEGGVNFSAGQRQRLEIARAFVQKSPLMILDEATSSLDTSVEEKIYDALKQMSCSQLIIAHRLSTIRDCDRIIVMDEGKIVAEGSHDELLESSSIYQSLLELE